MSKRLDNSDNLTHPDDSIGVRRKRTRLSAAPIIRDNSFELMTEAEVIRFLRIPESSSSKDYHNVIENLKRVRGLPRIHICRKPLYPKKAVREWVEKQIGAEK